MNWLWRILQKPNFPVSDRERLQWELELEYQRASERDKAKREMIHAELSALDASGWPEKWAKACDNIRNMPRLQVANSLSVEVASWNNRGMHEATA